MFTTIIIINGICIIYTITVYATCVHIIYIIVYLILLILLLILLRSIKEIQGNGEKCWGKACLLLLFQENFKQCSTKFFKDEPTHLCAAAT